MTPEQERYLEFYEQYRRKAQSDWYRNRYQTYERAHQQSVTLTALVLFLSSVVSILSVAWGRPRLWNDTYVAWPVLAAVLAAAGTAIAAYRSLYGFQENARLYRDADNALAAVLADSPIECGDCPEAAIRTPEEYLPRVEEVFRREQGQWGQLVAQIHAVTVPEAGPGQGNQGGARGGMGGGGGGGGTPTSSPAGATGTAAAHAAGGASPDAGGGPNAAGGGGQNEAAGTRAASDTPADGGATPDSATPPPPAEPDESGAVG